MRPVGGKSTLERDQVQRASRKCFSLEYEEIQQQYDVQDQKDDTTDEESLAEGFSDTGAVPLLMRQKADQDRDGHTAAPHQDDPEPPLIIHILQKRTPAVFHILDDEYSRIDQKSSRLKKRAEIMALGKKKHQKRQRKRRQQQDHFLCRGQEDLTHTDTKRMQKHTQHESCSQDRRVCLRNSS